MKRSRGDKGERLREERKRGEYLSLKVFLLLQFLISAHCKQPKTGGRKELHKMNLGEAVITHTYLCKNVRSNKSKVVMSSKVRVKLPCS